MKKCTCFWSGNILLSIVKEQASCNVTYTAMWRDVLGWWQFVTVQCSPRWLTEAVLGCILFNCLYVFLPFTSILAFLLCSCSVYAAHIIAKNYHDLEGIVAMVQGRIKRTGSHHNYGKFLVWLFELNKDQWCQWPAEWKVDRNAWR